MVLKGLLIGVLVGLLCFIIFRSVQGPVHLWDEALYANNALDMVKHGQYLVYTVADTVDHHNTKPPLVLWMQAAAGASVGFGELSVRLPTYLALVGVLVILVVYLYRFTGSMIPGLLASLFCLTTLGLIRHHVFLTGDLDGVLVFWTTWITLHWIHWLRKPSVRPKEYAVLTGLFYAGYLTKSTAVLLLLPTLVVIGCFYWQRFKTLILSRYTVGSILAFSTLCAAYYLIREQYDPGYWAIVWWSEFTRLGADVQPWLHFQWSLYFELLYDPLFQEYILLLAVLLIPFLCIRNDLFKRVGLALIAGAAIYLVVISYPPVKMEWYAAPVYPMLCAALALVVGSLTRSGLNKPSGLRLVAVTALWIVVGITIKNSFIHVAGELADEPHSGYTHQTIPDAVKIFHDRYPDVNAFKVLIPPTPARFAHHLDELTFYKNVYEHYENKTVTVSDSTVVFKAGDTLISNRELADQLATQYRISRLDSTAGGALWVVLNPPGEVNPLAP
jgi:4-amino-4-deoxy-L-arabinose transferase-like glycosyltransferase